MYFGGGCSGEAAAIDGITTSIPEGRSGTQGDALCVCSSVSATGVVERCYLGELKCGINRKLFRFLHGA
eukprot:4637675-Pyramimonas_sp.AAC.1